MEIFQEEYLRGVMYQKEKAAVRASNELATQNQNLTIFWNTNDGRCIPFPSLDSDHIINIVSLLLRRQKEFQEVKDLANSKGLSIMEPKVQGRTVDSWITLLLEELDRRVNAEEEKAIDAVKKAKENLRNIRDALK